MANLLSDPREPPGSDPVQVLLRKDAPTPDARVTVIISLYNYARFMGACLDSIRAQTLAELELIVVDDRSSDASPEVVRRWLEDHSDRFRGFQLLRHQVNRGLARTRNTAFAHSRTPFVFVLDADNMLYPRCLERLLAALQQCDASFAYCYAERFGDVQEVSNYKPWDPSRFAGGNEIDAMVLLRRSVWEELKGYSTDMPVMGWEDFDLWFKLARAQGWGVLVPEILTRYRVHGTSMLRTVTNPRAEALWSHLRVTYPEFFPEQSPTWRLPLALVS